MTPNTILSRLGLTPEQVATTAARIGKPAQFVEIGSATGKTTSLYPASGLVFEANKSIKRPSAKLSSEQVIRIRELAAQAAPKIPLARIALDFGLSMPATSRVIRGETYHDIGGPITRRNIVRHYEGKRLFSHQEVVAIREEHHFRKVRICVIAKREGVPWDSIGCMVHGRTYKDCGGPISPLTRIKKGIK